MKYRYLKNPKKGFYLLPNLFTMAALFAAFFSIVSALNGQFKYAALAIFVSMIADTFDGRVARLIGCESDFGAEFDSLADMVSFGVAPALVAYSWSLARIGKLGWLIGFVYTACTALRLARFNTQVAMASKQYFQGLPSPAAAAVIASMVWFSSKYGVSGLKVDILMALATALVSCLMVSNVRYDSFKEFNLKGRLPFITGFFIALIFIAIAINPPLMLLILFLIYACSGPLLTLWRIRQARIRRKQQLKLL